MKNQRVLISGMTLVELLVSMAISLILVGGIITVVMSSRESFETESEGSFIQENARFAITTIMRDIRMAGSIGCGHFDYSAVASPVQVDATSASIFGMFSLEPLSGYEANSGTHPSGLTDESETSDAIVLRYANPGKVAKVSGHNSASTVFNVSGTNPGLESGDILAIVDATCRHVGIFQARAASGSTITYGTGGLNCSDVVLTDQAISTCPGTSAPYKYQQGSEILPYVAHAYFVANSNVVVGDPPVPALKRRVMSGGTAFTEELAQGVEVLEIQYGVANIAGGTETQQFVDAGAVSDWSLVKSVRVQMVLRSLTQVNEQARNFSFNGEDFLDVPDRYMRQLVSTVVDIRNN